VLDERTRQDLEREVRSACVKPDFRGLFANEPNLAQRYDQGNKLVAVTVLSRCVEAVKGYFVVIRAVEESAIRLIEQHIAIDHIVPRGAWERVGGARTSRRRVGACRNLAERPRHQST
jgi:hypothetical protein